MLVMMKPTRITADSGNRVPLDARNPGLDADKPSSHVTVQRYHFHPSLQHVEML